ncbi:MAG: glycine cleavage T C-terminal barrel domain-containing protein, partial [Acidimicrobiales bacterium]
ETFRGRDRVLEEQSRGPRRQLAGVWVEGRQPLRDGGEVFINGSSVGPLTSGNFSPVLERGIGMGLLAGEFDDATPVSVTLRGRDIAGTITTLPFVRKVK